MKEFKPNLPTASGSLSAAVLLLNLIMQISQHEAV